LEVIRLRILVSPLSRGEILQFAAELLNEIRIDNSLLLSVKVARVKIERWEEKSFSNEGVAQLVDVKKP
jgi:hypothetical protein